MYEEAAAERYRNEALRADFLSANDETTDPVGDVEYYEAEEREEITIFGELDKSEVRFTYHMSHHNPPSLSHVTNPNSYSQVQVHDEVSGVLYFSEFSTELWILLMCSFTPLRFAKVRTQYWQGNLFP